MAGNGGLLLPLGVQRLRAYGSTRNAHYCYTRVTAGGTNVEADIDVMDEHGTVLLVVRGLLMGTGFSESADRDRQLGERLLTIEWQQRELPEDDRRPTPGTWLLIGFSDASGCHGSAGDALTHALKLHGAECTTMRWSRHADHAANAERA